MRQSGTGRACRSGIEISRRIEIPEEKAMKRVMLMMVFLVLWSAVATAVQPRVVWAGDREINARDDSKSSDGDESGLDVITTYGATDSGNDGDPGDAGDGYGFSLDMGLIQSERNAAPLVLEFLWMMIAIEQELNF